MLGDTFPSTSLHSFSPEYSRAVETKTSNENSKSNSSSGGVKELKKTTGLFAMLQVDPKVTPEEVCLVVGGYIEKLIREQFLVVVANAECLSCSCISR